MKKWVAWGLMVASVTAFAAEFSGAWSTTFSLKDTWSSWNTLHFTLSSPGWELQGSSILEGVNLAGQSFTLRGFLGYLGVAAGVTLRPLGELRGDTWSTQRFHLTGGFIAFELRAGAFRFSLTVMAGPEGP